MKTKYKELLGKTEQEQIDKAKELLNMPLQEGEDPAGRLAIIESLLFEQDEQFEPNDED